jgi:hypothetical protein
MSGDTYDVQGEVRDALNTAVEGYGKRVLNDPRVLGNLVGDLLPDLPRERSLLVTGAEAGVAAELTQHVEGQRMDADTAVSLTARSLAESRALEPAASMWVATEYAKALGYQVRSQVPPSMEAVTDNPPWPHDETQTANQVFPPIYSPPGPVPPVTPPGPVPVTTPIGSVPPAGPWPSAQPQRKSRLGLFLGGGVAAVIVLYLIIAAVASTFPFTKAKVTPTPTPPVSPSVSPPVSPSTSPSVSPSVSPSTSPSTSPSVSPSATGTLAALPAGLKPLKVLLPIDIQDASTECVDPGKAQWTNPGLVKAFGCAAPDMAGGNVLAYQMDSTADYNQAWANYNTWANFETSKTLDCPPGSGQSQGGPGEWWDGNFPQRAGQVLECFGTSTGPVYVWTYPTENTFMIAQPPQSWSFSQLETWWEHNSV